MAASQNNSDELRRELRELERKGIQIDRDRLKENICSQFPDYRLWIREYIVNAYDAQAKSCWISGRQDEDTISVRIRDDGGGMDRDGVEAFLTKFRSLKQREDNAVGRFGIGSFSIAAIPGQSALAMVTSTGGETWRMTTGPLLSSDRVVAEQITPVQPHGTTFTVTFARTELSVGEELKLLEELARRHLYHLPIAVHFGRQIATAGVAPAEPAWIAGNWTEDPQETFSRRYCFDLTPSQKKYNFDVILGIGVPRQQIYQQHVLVAENRPDHDLLSQDIEVCHIRVAHLSIRVESPQFDLPLGRHCLRNPEVLRPLARHLRETILPSYLEELTRIYESGSTDEFALRPSDIEDVLCSWIAGAPRSDTTLARGVAVFRGHNGKRYRYDELSLAVEEQGCLYLEAESSSGLDYSVFNAPVLSLDQPDEGLALLQRDFGENLINLSVVDLVQEAPAQTCEQLTSIERRFGQSLGFSAETRQEFKILHDAAEEVTHSFGLSDAAKANLEKAARKVHDAWHELEATEWTVGRLVGRDGKTPCPGALFLRCRQRVVLNLHHPEIARLVRMSELAPNLAGHFATALCLEISGQNALLTHLAPEDRELLIHFDSIHRCGRDEVPADVTTGSLPMPPTQTNRMKFCDFLRHVSESDFRF